MAESESVLLKRFACGGDSAAFNEIVQRHAGLVYGTCLRVLSDADLAADATQETFFQLVKRADQVKGSVAGWLHRVAVGKAVDVIRRDARRRSREQVYADVRPGSDASWREVRPHVDEALSQLDEPTREVLLRHFLEGQSMAALAGELGVSRPTVSRRVASGLTELRSQLRKRGVMIAAGGLSSLLAENAAQSAPLSLLRDIGRIALVGAKVGAGSSAAASGAGALTGGVLAATKAKLVIAATAAVIGVGFVTYKRLAPRTPQSPPTPPLVAQDSRRARPQRQIPPAPRPEPPVARETVESDSSPAEGTSPKRALPSEEPETPIVLPPASAPAEAVEETGFELDLSSPEATVRSFIKAMASGDGDAALACFMPDGEDYGDMEEAINADPDDPAQRSEYGVKMLFQSLDPEAEMPMLSVEETEHGTSVVWQVTFKSEFSIEGHTFNAGDTMDFDGTLRRSGDSWLIDNL